MMHPGVKKQALYMQRRFKNDETGLYNAIKEVKKGYSVCQACNRDNQNVRGEAQWTPIPDQPIESAATDVFSMPEVDCKRGFRLCSPVCGPTQWLHCGVPARKRGLLAKEAAVMTIFHWLTVFGVPRTIRNDRGPKFTGSWFKAMCALMGIQHAKSVSYLSWSDGRTELAGRQLFEELRKIHLTNKRCNWFEEMWPALKPHHDTPHWVACRHSKFFSAGTH